MYHVNTALDVFGIFVCLILATYLLGRGLKTRSERLFLCICLCDILFNLGDMTDWCCQGFARPWYPAALRVGQFVYYLSILPLQTCLYEYLMDYLKAGRRFRRVSDRIILATAAVHVALCVLTPFFGLFYVITPENTYQRGPLVLMSHAITAAVYLTTFLLLFLRRRAIPRRMAVMTLLFVCMPLTGQVAQFFLRGVGVLNPVITLALLFMFVNLQIDRDLQYEKSRRELTDAEARLLLSQIRPHFLYNALTAIRHLCQTDPQRAGECVSDFSLFLRANMDSIAAQRPIPFRQELGHAQSYLKLEQARFGDSVRVEYEIGAEDFLLPALSLQPLVENAVRHGLRKKEGGGTVAIRTRDAGAAWEVTVADDGAGFTPESLDSGGHIGIANVRRRLEVLCDGGLEIKSRPGEGTAVTIRIPKGDHL